MSTIRLKSFTWEFDSTEIFAHSTTSICDNYYIGVVVDVARGIFIDKQKYMALTPINIDTDNSMELLFFPEQNQNHCECKLSQQNNLKRCFKYLVVNVESEQKENALNPKNQYQFSAFLFKKTYKIDLRFEVNV